MALLARGDDVTVLQRRPARLPCREVLRRRRRPRRRTARGRRARTRSCTSRPRSTWSGRGRSSSGRTSWARRSVVDGVPVGRRRAAGPRVVAVGRARRARAGRGWAPEPADPARARGHYARSKAMAELEALAADSARSGRARGPPAPGVGAGRHPARRAASSSAPGPGGCRVVGSGAALIDTTYVDNAVDALVAALDACGRVHGEALVVSNGEPRPVAELLARAVPGRGRAGAASAGAVRRRVGGGRASPRASGRRCGARDDPADDAVPRRAAGDGALVRPAAHPRGAAVDAARRASTRGSRRWRGGTRGRPQERRSPAPNAPPSGAPEARDTRRVACIWLHSRVTSAGCARCRSRPGSAQRGARSRPGPGNVGTGGARCTGGAAERSGRSSYAPAPVRGVPEVSAAVGVRGEVGSTVDRDRPGQHSAHAAGRRRLVVGYRAGYRRRTAGWRLVASECREARAERTVWIRTARRSLRRTWRERSRCTSRPAGPHP